MPLSVSGVPARGFKRINALARRTGAEVLAYRGASASAVPAADPAEIVPGGNFAVALSYGDVTIGGVGTTSYVCDDRAVAFGHPPSRSARPRRRRASRNALTVVDDDVATPFKLATIGGTVGILDQDRIGGVRTLLGTTPNMTPIDSSFASRDTNRSREGQSDVVLD